MSLVHLFIDIPRFGAYAVRDASFPIEGIFGLIGFLWARKIKHANMFLKALSVLFFINFIYSLTFPIREELQAISPISGLFLQVPLFGFYSQTALFLMSGALFYFLVASRISVWPSLVFYLLALLQVAWLLVFQVRSMYVGIIVVVLLLILFSGIRRGLKPAFGIALGIISLIIIVPTFDIEIPGRIGPTEPEFLVQHFQSIFLILGTPAEGSARWRIELLPEIWERWTASTMTILIGEGFGRPLIDFYLAGGIAVRQPHNTHLSVLVRLGIFGLFLWFLIQWRILSLFLSKMRSLPRGSFERDVVLWFFLFYVLGILVTTTQPWLEFSYGAIPFFILTGFALGWMQGHENSISSPALSSTQNGRCHVA